jgi:hypothetical protein
MVPSGFLMEAVLAKIWSDSMIAAAQILARAGYSSSVAAEAMGITQGAVLGRSSRMKEFKFVRPRLCKKFNQEDHGRNVASAKNLISEIDIKQPPKPRPKMKKPATAMMLPVGANKRTNLPRVSRINVIVESPLSESERILITANEGPNNYSVVFSEMKNTQCKWIVDKDEFGEAVVCGRERYGHSSYCESHHLKGTARTKLKVLTSKLVYTWDQSIKLVEAKK